MKFKKIAALSTAVIMSASMLVGCGNNKSKENTDKSFKIGMVADIGGINDESFNQSAWEGLQKAEKDFGIEVKVIESKQASEYLQNMESLLDEDVDMVIGVGYTMKEDIEKQAKNYPDKQFVLIDETYDSIPENVTPILFRENEAAYLTGLVAGKMTENNNVGFIGGIQTPVISRFEYGYKAGVKEANKDVVVLCNTGCRLNTIERKLTTADAAVVGTTFKVDGVFENRVDVNRVKEFMEVVYKYRETLGE